MDGHKPEAQEEVPYRSARLVECRYDPKLCFLILSFEMIVEQTFCRID